jgi:hypothetical protein
MAEAFVAANGIFVVACFLIITSRHNCRRVIIFARHRSRNLRLRRLVLRHKSRFIANNRAKEFNENQAQPNRAQTAQISLSLDDAKNFQHLVGIEFVNNFPNL